jgi:hypothetical protein
LIKIIESRIIHWKKKKNTLLMMLAGIYKLSINRHRQCRQPTNSKVQRSHGLLIQESQPTHWSSYQGPSFSYDSQWKDCSDDPNWAYCCYLFCHHKRFHWYVLYYVIPTTPFHVFSVFFIPSFYSSFNLFWSLS